MAPPVEEPSRGGVGVVGGRGAPGTDCDCGRGERGEGHCVQKQRPGGSGDGDDQTPDRCPGKAGEQGRRLEDAEHPSDVGLTDDARDQRLPGRASGDLGRGQRCNQHKDDGKRAGNRQADAQGGLDGAGADQQAPGIGLVHEAPCPRSQQHCWQRARQQQGSDGRGATAGPIGGQQQCDQRDLIPERGHGPPDRGIAKIPTAPRVALKHMLQHGLKHMFQSAPVNA